MLDNFKHKSKVFDISLNEIAFILIFILLLLLGSLYIFKVKEVEKLNREVNDYRDSVGTLTYLNNIKTELMRSIEKNSPQDEKDLVKKLLDKRIDLAKYEQLENILNNLSATNDIKYIDKILVSSQEKQNLKDLKILYDLINNNLAECKNPEQFISNLILKDECNAQKQALIQQLAEMKDQLQQREDDLSKFSDLQQALAAKKISLDDLNDLSSLIKDNSDLRGQLEYMQNTLKGNGVDHPPCWVSESGKIEYLFNIDMYANYLTLTPIWPEYRNQDAAKLPNINALTANNISYSKFQTLAAPIFDLSMNSKSECRFFVRIKSHIATAKESDDARHKIEAFFYKLEVR